VVSASFSPRWGAESSVPIASSDPLPGVSRLRTLRRPPRWGLAGDSGRLRYPPLLTRQGGPRLTWAWQGYGASFGAVAPDDARGRSQAERLAVLSLSRRVPAAALRPPFARRHRNRRIRTSGSITGHDRARRSAIRGAARLRDDMHISRSSPTRQGQGRHGQHSHKQEDSPHIVPLSLEPVLHPYGPPHAIGLRGAPSLSAAKPLGLREEFLTPTVGVPSLSNALRRIGVYPGGLVLREHDARVRLSRARP
jgi:hypothetical protein